MMSTPRCSARDLLVLGNAAEIVRREQADAARDRLNRAVDLQSELTGRGEDEGARLAAHLAVLATIVLHETLDERRPEGDGLAGTGLAAAENILAGENVGDGRCLDRERRLRSQLDELANDVATEAEVSEGHAFDILGDRGRRLEALQHDVVLWRECLLVTVGIEVALAASRTLDTVVEVTAARALVRRALVAVVVARALRAGRAVVVRRALGTSWAVVVARTLRPGRAVTVGRTLSARRTVAVRRAIVGRALGTSRTIPIGRTLRALRTVTVGRALGTCRTVIVGRTLAAIWAVSVRRALGPVRAIPIGRALRPVRAIPVRRTLGPVGPVAIGGLFARGPVRAAVARRTSTIGVAAAERLAVSGRGSARALVAVFGGPALLRRGSTLGGTLAAMAGRLARSGSRCAGSGWFLEIRHGVLSGLFSVHVRTERNAIQRAHSMQGSTRAAIQTLRVLNPGNL